MLKLKFGLILVILMAINRGGADEDSEEVAISTEATISLSESDLDEQKCAKERKGCCSQLYIGDEDDMVKCFTIHAPKLPADGESDVGKTVKFLSCFVECMYKQKKYIGKNDSINMKMVKLDAENMYKDHPKEKKFHIEMFEYCRKEGVNIYNLIKSSPGSNILLKGACRPYLLMVFLCQTDYHEKHGCPYFRWEGTEKGGTAQMCKDSKAKCYEIDGLVPPTKSSL